MRLRVIMSTIMAFFCVIFAIAVLVNILNYVLVTREADETLNEIVKVETNKNIPWGMPGSFQGADGMLRPAPFFGLPNPESSYITRFFFVVYDNENNVIFVSTDNIASVDDEQAETLGNKVVNAKKDNGYLQKYRYLRQETDSGSIVVFLNIVQNQQFLRMVAFVTLLVSIVGLIIVSILAILFSKKAIQPIAQNIEAQKQFITDASHELKTPLTSIMTSLDVITMTNGEDEWTENIRKQTERMSKLVSELVMLSRLDEVNPLPNKERFSVSNVAWELFEVYQPQINAFEKKFEAKIDDDVFMFGDKSAIHQMLSVLIDNAIRYSLEAGDIELKVSSLKNKAFIEVSNSCDYDEHIDVNKLFDRFYRPDASRNVNLGGNGIGLAIAKAAVETHGGSIKASCPEGKRMIIQVIV